MAEHGKITARNALPDPATLLCFFAAAALSGIIGGIAYDCVKKAIRTIVCRAKSVEQNIGQSRVVLDGDEIDSFISYVRQYCLDRGSIDDGVLIEIQEEELVWELTDATTTLISETATPTKEEIAAAVRKAFGNVREPERPENHDFNTFWKELPNKTNAGDA